MVKHVGLFAVLLIVTGAACSGEDTEPPTTTLTRPTSTSVAATAETAAAIELATEFVEAFWAFDADLALSYLAVEGLQGQDRDEFRLEHDQRRIWRNVYRPAEPCWVVEISEAGVVVRCPYEYDSLGSDVLGLGPFVDNYEDLTVRDGTIVARSVHDPNGFAFSENVWKPFLGWARSNHPEDAEVLFGEEWWLTEESFRLWERRLAEYIEFRTDS